MVQVIVRSDGGEEQMILNEEVPNCLVESFEQAVEWIKGDRATVY